MHRLASILACAALAADAAPTVARDVLFVSAQRASPDSIWACEAYGANLRALGVPTTQVAMLFSGAPSPGSRRLAAAGFRVETYDVPETDPPTITRLRLLAAFFHRHALEASGERVLVHAADAAFTAVPAPLRPASPPSAKVLASVPLAARRPPSGWSRLLDFADGLDRKSLRKKFGRAVPRLACEALEDTEDCAPPRDLDAWDVGGAALFPRGLPGAAHFFEDAAKRASALHAALAALDADVGDVAGAVAPFWLLRRLGVDAEGTTALGVGDVAADDYAAAAAAPLLGNAFGAFRNDPVDRLCADAAAVDPEEGSGARLYAELALDEAARRRHDPGCAARPARDVLFVTAQPDIPFLRWQCFAYLRNFLDRGARAGQVAMVFGLAPGERESAALAALRAAGARVSAYADDRPPTAAREYTGSIRLYLMAKWVRENAEELSRRRVFYHDGDIVFPRRFPPLLTEAAFPAARAKTSVVMADAINYTGFAHIQKTHDVFRRINPDVDTWAGFCGPLRWPVADCRRVVRRHEGSAGIFSQALLTGLWDPDFWYDAWETGDAQFLAHRPREIAVGVLDWSWGTRQADIQMSFKADMLAPLWLLWKAADEGAQASETLVSGDFAFGWAISPRIALDWYPILHMAGAAGRCGDLSLGAPAGTCGFFKNEWVLRSPAHALCQNPAEFDYVSEASASHFYVETLRAVAARGLPGVDACDPSLYEGEPALMKEEYREDGALVKDYYARRALAPEPPTCGAAGCRRTRRIIHTNITDVSIMGTTTSTKRETVEHEHLACDGGDVCPN